MNKINVKIHDNQAISLSKNNRIIKFITTKQICLIEYQSSYNETISYIKKYYPA